MHIAFDVDGVIYDFVSALRGAVMRSDHATAAQRAQAEIHDFSTSTWNFWEQWGMTQSQVHSVICHIGFHEVFADERYVDPFVAGIAEDMIHEGHRVTLITRSWPHGGNAFRSARFDLAMSMFDSGLHPNGLVIVDWDEAKHSYPFDVIVEDHLETAVAAFHAGRRAVLIDRPWNRDVSDFDVSSWPERISTENLGWLLRNMAGRDA